MISLQDGVAVQPAVADTAPSQRNNGVLAAAASGLCEFIVKHGGDPDRVLGVSGVDPEMLQRPTLSVALPSYCQALEEAARQSGSENFGLHYGQQFMPQALGLLGYIGLCSATLREALINFSIAFPLHQRNSLIRLVDLGDCYRFDYQVRHGAILARRQDAELTLGMTLNLIRHVLGRHWGPRAVSFEHPRPGEWHEHWKAFNAPVYFGEPLNSMLIPKQDLDCGMPQHDPVLLAVMQDSLRQIAFTERRAPDIVLDTRSQIHRHLTGGVCSQDRIAEQLGLGSWALQRRLKDRGVTFSELVDAVRREMAAHYLNQPQLAISDVAPLLGYSELSAFTRAFRRWYGVSPRRWRLGASGTGAAAPGARALDD